MIRSILKKTRKTRSRKGSSDEAVGRYVAIALRQNDVMTRWEDDILHEQLAAMCEADLAKGDDSDIERALEAVKNDAEASYDTLLTAAEDCAESYRAEDGSFRTLMLVPVLVWSRYLIRWGRLDNEETLKKIAGTFLSLYCGQGARAVIGNCLLASEHMPERLSHVRRLLDRMAENTGAGPGCSVADISNILGKAESAPPPDFSDSRYLVLAVLAGRAQDTLPPAGADYTGHAKRAMDFSMACHDALAEEMVGCMFSVQPPASFYTAWRQSEQAMRIFSLQSLTDFVQAMGFGLPDLVATTALFHRMPESETEPNDEVRVSMSTRYDPQKVLAGVVWPTMNEDPEESQKLAGSVLASAGVATVHEHVQVFPMEWCEDCGAPLYANPDGLVTHVEPPGNSPGNEPPTLN